MELYWILFAIWYLIGVGGGLLIIKKQNSCVTVGKFIFCITLGGLTGLLFVIIGLYVMLDDNDFWNKKLF